MSLPVGALLSYFAPKLCGKLVTGTQDENVKGMLLVRNPLVLEMSVTQMRFELTSIKITQPLSSAFCGRLIQ